MGRDSRLEATGLKGMRTDPRIRSWFFPDPSNDASGPCEIARGGSGFKHKIPLALWGKVLGSSQESARALRVPERGVSRD